MSLLAILRDYFAKPAEMRQRSVLCAHPGGLHRMAYTEWGDPKNPKVLLCVHGLTRNGRDFDFLAQALAEDYRVVCPDVAGRGRSEWLPDKALYGFPQYVADMVTLLARLDCDSVHWVGTSMGGLIGMFLASIDKTPITRLVLNDVGPVITTESLRRIGEYVGNAPRFPSLEAAEAFVRQVSAPFGKLSDAKWRHLTVYCVHQEADGQWAMVYDPGIAEPFRAAFMLPNVDLWPVYEAIRCPTMVIRGAQSDLLDRAVWQGMAARGPKASLAEIPEVGHAPTLLDGAQIAVVRDFLLA
jgi:pimeloyl-ACP methyl ester carboxylesterase